MELVRQHGLFDVADGLGRQSTVLDGTLCVVGSDGDQAI